MRVSLFATLGALLLATVSPSTSSGACNTIPDPKVQLLSGPNPTPDATALAAAVHLDQEKFGPTFKGTLGRVDRAFLSQAVEHPLQITFDGQCVGGGHGAPLQVEDTTNLLAATIYADEGQPSTAVVSVGAGLSCSAFQRSKERSLSVVACADDGIRRSDRQKTPMVTVKFPAMPDAPEPRPVRVAVFRATSPAAGTTLLERVASAGCSALCTDPATVGEMGACIDTLFAPVALAAGQIVYAPDLVKCALLQVPTPIPWNDFAKLCEAGPDAGTLPACQNMPDLLSMWEDACHGVYVPFDWTSVRQVSSTSTVDRVVRGQSGISRRAKVAGGRVWVPGREYVGTLAEVDLAGTGPFVTDPRKAAIDVWYPSKQEFGLQGVVDKDKSIVHVVPRLATSFLCDDTTASGASDEGCMRVATQPALDSSRCACTDRYDAGCTCSTLSQGRFFQCATTKRPCTRHAHCNPGDTCSARPRCQKAGEVWDPAQLPPGGVACWTDADCASNAARPQCGFLLFDVGKKRETGSTVVKLGKAVAPTATRKQRGICSATPVNLRKACSNENGAGNPPACGTADGTCVGYKLEALGSK